MGVSWVSHGCPMDVSWVFRGRLTVVGVSELVAGVWRMEGRRAMRCPVALALVARRRPPPPTIRARQVAKRIRLCTKTRREPRFPAPPYTVPCALHPEAWEGKNKREPRSHAPPLQRCLRFAPRGLGETGQREPSSPAPPWQCPVRLAFRGPGGKSKREPKSTGPP